MKKHRHKWEYGIDIVTGLGPFRWCEECGAESTQYMRRRKTKL